jgi:hypothetical protein
MTHPVVQQTIKLILAGDVAGAEHALVAIADEEGDDALVAILDEIPPKDLLAMMREFDSSRESVINMVVSPEQFARAVILEQKYRDRTHEALRGMINAVVHANGDMAGEYLEAIGEIDGGYDTFANYFAERFEEVLHFAMTGEFSEQMPESSMENKSITWLAEKVEEIDEALNLGDSISDTQPRITRAEASDGDWMETAWVLRHEHPDIFEQVIILLRDRMQRFAEQAAAAIQNPVAESSEPGEVEESAI